MIGKRKAIFFDVDDTLWDSHNEIPESTLEAIRRLQKNGHLCFINTGRSRGHVTNPKLLSIGFDGIVTGCGTMIEYRDEILFLREIEPERMEAALSVMREYGFRPILEGREYLYLEYEDFKDDPYGSNLIADLGEHFKEIHTEWGRWNVCKFSCATDPERQAAGLEALSGEYDALIHTPEVVEIVPKGFDKGTGIAKVCELLGIDLADTVAFGDSVNDLAMIRAAGIGIAMGNGTDVIKEAADYVTTPMKEDGIMNACIHFGLI